MSFLDENLTPSVTQETDASLVALGQRGCVSLFDGGTATGNFAAIQCLSDCVFAALDTVEGSDANSPFYPLVNNGATIPTGTILYGPITYIDLNSGGVAIAYKA